MKYQEVTRRLEKSQITDKACMGKINWILEQSIPTEKKVGMIPKKKKKAKTSQPALTSGNQTKVKKEKQNDSVDDGFTVVTKGAIIRDAVAIKKRVSPSLFEISEEETQDDVIPVIADEDVSEWNGYAECILL